MKVCELFTSIQGESSYAGRPCTFVRLSGCNLSCSYCDTRYAAGEGSEVSAEDILGFVRKAGLPLVEITGGEPLMQEEELQALLGRLLDEGYTVLIETNGSYSIRNLDSRAVIILDIKTPGSGMDDSNDFGNLKYLKPSDEIKFVIGDRNDYDWSKGIVEKFDLGSRNTILFAPVADLLEPRELVAWIVSDRLQVRLNLQLHKFIFGEDERGV